MEGMYWTLLAVVCLGLVGVQSDNANILANYPKHSSKRLCGRHLADMLGYVCAEYGFAQKFKKSENEPDYGYQSDQEDQQQQQQQLDIVQPLFPFRSRPAAVAMYPRSIRRLARTVTEECCHKSCSIEEMKSYCAY